MVHLLMHPTDWADTAHAFNAIFGPVGTLAVGFSIVSIIALTIVWRTLTRKEGAQTAELLSIVGANTASHERNAAAQRESGRVVEQLSVTIGQLGQTLRDTEERTRHHLDLLLQPHRAMPRRRKAR